MRNDVNIRSSRYVLARAIGTCRHCCGQTPLYALAVPPGHLALELDDRAQTEEDAVDTWRIAPHGAWLFHIEFLAEPVSHRLRLYTRSFRPGEGPAADTCWSNHCELCDSPQDDPALFCEPDGAFSPVDEAGAAAILLQPIDEAFAATVAGYAHEHSFFGTRG